MSDKVDFVFFQKGRVRRPWRWTENEEVVEGTNSQYQYLRQQAQVLNGPAYDTVHTRIQ